VTAEESDAYFQSRQRGSRLAALASPQSRVIADRRALDARMQEMEERYRDRAVPRPSFWGGYRVVPETIEFWQSQPNRLHNRIRYRRSAAGGWLIERLAP
jgi:pyridoxamine 5'-phosphate oxidase